MKDLTNIIVVLISLSMLSSSYFTKNLVGKYIGYSVGEIRTRKDENNMPIEEKKYSKKTLELFKNKTFSFDYWLYCQFCTSQGGIAKSCTGEWTTDGDTLFLTSRYRPEDFYEIDESYKPYLDSEVKLIEVSNRTSDNRPGAWFDRVVQVSFGGNNIGSCKINDSTYFLNNSMTNEFIVLSNDEIHLKWKYKIKNPKSNHFVFKLKWHNSGQNLYFEKYKLLIVEDKLVPLHFNQDFYVEPKGYFKKQ